jgi:hypothetical protein
MTPKEKALKLTEKMAIHHWTDVCDYESAKQCALIAVDEILKADIENKLGVDVEYWQEVKQEIEKL